MSVRTVVGIGDASVSGELRGEGAQLYLRLDAVTSADGPRLRPVQMMRAQLRGQNPLAREALTLPASARREWALQAQGGRYFLRGANAAEQQLVGTLARALNGGISVLGLEVRVEARAAQAAARG